MQTKQTFGQVIKALQQGNLASREGWNGKDMYIFRQVPSVVPAEIIPKMSSLPPAVKEKLVATGKAIVYQNQMCIIYPDNTIHGWTPSTADVLATDWIIYTSATEQIDTVEASSVTVGTGKPI